MITLSSYINHVASTGRGDLELFINSIMSDLLPITVSNKIPVVVFSTIMSISPIVLTSVEKEDSYKLTSADSVWSFIINKIVQQVKNSSVLATSGNSVSGSGLVTLKIIEWIILKH